MIQRGHVIPEIPDVVRVRALARARSTMAASAVAPSPLPPTRVPLRWLRVALTTSTAMAVGVAGAATALHWRALQRQEASAPAPRHAVALARELPPDPPEALDLAAEPLPPARQVPRALQTREAQESYAAEIALLQRAQAAYAGGNYSEALAQLARHNRKFPNGRLAEEREGLRVRSLLGSGQTQEAGRVVVAFNRRFPRSVLLPHLQEMMKARE